ncbi:hypothetical protein [Bacilliculturomica massiliensis]|uniref:hypothetical protein n=1 Tax=Bacilliculturomica massiliensis TaxID=1917867 RepID=UPI001031C22B|nr:hypothetical protein [Bacilliculturomica massiliensis]
MNPLLLLIVILIFSNNGRGRGPHPGGAFPLARQFNAPHIDYFDTFKMELLLDRLRAITDALDKLNHLRQMQNLPPSRENSMNRIQDSVDAAKGFLADTKAAGQLDTISDTLSGVKQLGDMSGLISSMGPILSMLTAGNDNK